MSATEIQTPQTTFPNPNDYAPVPESAEVQEFAAHQGPVEDTIPGRDTNLDALVERHKAIMKEKAENQVSSAVQNGVKEALASVEPTEDEEAWDKRNERAQQKELAVTAIASATGDRKTVAPVRARAHQLAHR